MSTGWLRNPILRMALIASGLALALSGCHLHHGYLGGSFGYYGGGYHGGHYRGHHYKRHGYHRHHRYRRGGWRGHGGWRGRY